MSCIKSLFRCNYNDTTNNSNQIISPNNWCEKNFTFLRQKIIDLELDVKALKVAHDLEIKRIEDKLSNQIQILTNKIDSLALLLTNISNN